MRSDTCAVCVVCVVCVCVCVCACMHACACVCAMNECIAKKELRNIGILHCCTADYNVSLSFCKYTHTHKDRERSL